MVNNKCAVTPEKAIEILKKKGVTITPENADVVIDFLYILAQLFYKQHREL